MMALTQIPTECRQLASYRYSLDALGLDAANYHILTDSHHNQQRSGDNQQGILSKRGRNDFHFLPGAATYL